MQLRGVIEVLRAIGFVAPLTFSLIATSIVGSAAGATSAWIVNTVLGSPVMASMIGWGVESTGGGPHGPSSMRWQEWVAEVAPSAAQLYLMPCSATPVLVGTQTRTTTADVVIVPEAGGRGEISSAERR